MFRLFSAREEKLNLQRMVLVLFAMPYLINLRLGQEISANLETKFPWNKSLRPESSLGLSIGGPTRPISQLNIASICLKIAMVVGNRETNRAILAI